ncbi:amino acid adenylation domain-containing protein [Nitrosomonas ureae]|uniref:Amino acid adenylation domain-containing protein n=1 Tax=Nitrosomonas ureae TaxID=44577 RepID=A0A285BUB0_9PROT|nr:non-ribosomal peptide synthetase [Nitrosomonas ureae]SNX58812.1 amino acid adenylation domain-containing protein [Nitrosomonas ureae]
MNTRLIPSRCYPDNFVTHLQTLARERSVDTALIVISAENEILVDKKFDYASLDLQVRALAAVMQNHFSPGERALLLLNNDEHYVISFLACLYTGIIAVPIFPPESLRERYLARLLAIADDAQAACILTSSKILPLITSVTTAQFSEATILTVDTIDQANASRWQTYIPKMDEIAFLQYTSGSTSTPKGVMVSHLNLMMNAKAFEEGMSINENDIFVSWLPLYHDMGLIGGLLQPIHRGIPAILMTPNFFIEKPVRWLEVISRYRATVSGAPNFAFQLCVDRVRSSQLLDIDLSTWRVAFSGAEPVRRETMQAFIECFSPVGFSAGTIYPCYGLAEATLFVTGGVRGEGMQTHEFSSAALALGRAELATEGMPVVACGFPASNHSIKIVDPEKLIPLSDGNVGEIWTMGPSLTCGYWKRPQETAQAFVHIEGECWLRTGDLGFIHAHQLYIMGRCKDLIIIRGQNIYPQDVELTIEEEVEAVRKGRVAAFSVQTAEGEGIGVAVEVSRNMQKLISVEALIEVLSEAVSASCNEPLSVALLLNPGALPKTSSGKLQRTACRQGWLERTLDAYAIYEYGYFILDEKGQLPQALTDETEIAVAAVWESVLSRTVLTREDHFFAIGGNSLTAIQVAAHISEHWSIQFTPRNLFHNPRLHECAAEIKGCLSSSSSQFALENRILPLRNKVNALPLSFGQQRLWFLWQLDPSSNAYNIQHALRLSGALNKYAFYASIDDLIERHESLHTIFRVADDGAVEQFIHPEIPNVVTGIDLRDITITKREAEVAKEVQRIISIPFDLTQGPLLRIALIQVTESESIFVIIMHHIVSDGVSVQILLNELAAFYQAHVQGKSACLDNLPIQYVDYTVWQQAWLEAGEKDRQLAYWRDYLGDEHPILLLPANRVRQPVTSYQAGRYSFDLPPDGLNKLRQLALRRGATLFITLLTAFQALLFRYTGQQDIRVGVPVAGRNRIETARLIGFFVNTQVLQSQLDGRMSLDELLNQTRESAINAQSYQDLPFEQLVEALHPQRDLRHSPLFQVTFNHLLKDFRIFQEFSGLAPSDYSLPEQSAQLELRLETIELPDGSVSASFIYASDLFNSSWIKRLGQHYLRILEALADCPGVMISDIDLLSEEDKQQLETWGNHWSDISVFQPIHQLIEHQAESNPNRVAIISGHIELSYAELNCRSNQLAHRLIDLGVKPEMGVGIAIERNSIELIIGLLAILKAGGGYVPLDPEYPTERLDYMLEDSGIQLLLTQAHIKSRIPHKEGIEILALDALDLSAELKINPEIALHDQSLAYVIYTSGSTGRPKGVPVAHGSLAMHLSAIKEIYDVRPDDRELMFFSMNFDAAAEQWITPLTQGAALVLSSTSDLAGDGFVDLIEKHRITTLHLPPAYLRMLLPLMSGKAHTVRTCIAGGEAWYATDVMAVRDAFRNARLVNAYGPTETVITPAAWISHADKDGRICIESEYVPIGVPVGARNLYVLDAQLNLVPPDVIGELYVGGEGLARGYLRRPTLTSERFIPDPFGSPGSRLYRTGDWVRWRDEGKLEYLGRVDQQIKIRGFRVELGEIEAQILAQTGVREVAVLAHEGHGDLRLVAYLVPHNGVQLSSTLLKTSLAAALPEYMIPGLFVFLEALPLNPNGKIDRKALPLPEQYDKTDYDPPVNALEMVIAEIWSEVLEIPQVGLQNNFFDLGGHSLLLIKVKQKLEERLNIHIAIVDLFKYTTVASLAKFVSQGDTRNASLQRHRERAQRQRSTFIQRKQKAERIQ